MDSQQQQPRPQDSLDTRELAIGGTGLVTLIPFEFNLPNRHRNEVDSRRQSGFNKYFSRKQPKPQELLDTRKLAIGATGLKLIPCELHVQTRDSNLLNRHQNEVEALASNLNKLVEQLHCEDTHGEAVPSQAEAASGHSTATGSRNSRLRGLRGNVRRFLPQRGRDPLFSSGALLLPYSCDGELPPTQVRIHSHRREHHFNYPIIPRSRDRARLRRMQISSPTYVPPDLPPWSVRAYVPTPSQPDWSEDDRLLEYDGFSPDLYTKYTTELERGRVPVIPLPYREEDMKRILVEKGLLTDAQADKMCKDGPEYWRGPMEWIDDEKNEEEMRKILETDGENINILP